MKLEQARRSIHCSVEENDRFQSWKEGQHKKEQVNSVWDKAIRNTLASLNDPEATEPFDVTTLFTELPGGYGQEIERLMTFREKAREYREVKTDPDFISVLYRGGG